ncbi:MAG: tRNA (guanine(46)-N(7))-methyltransferase TrmB [Acidimicrobiales bacterium]|nr:tRNA (guanine(46)-N(7))-methyltransferase TrmB [Acidimicrobiales bacterium]
MRSQQRSPEEWRRARIRTAAGRHGRTTDRMRRVLAELEPHHGLDARPDPTRPLVLEVGCGHGEAAWGFAEAHPALDVLAVDVHVPGIVELLDQMEVGKPPNLFAERADGLDLLDHVFGPHSLAGLILAFPDPWPKAKHHKRRFVRPDVLDLLADRLVPGSPVYVATDHADYAEWAVEHLDEHPEFIGGVSARPAWRPITRYERTGLDAGHDIVDLAYHRR